MKQFISYFEISNLGTYSLGDSNECIYFLGLNNTFEN